MNHRPFTAPISQPKKMLDIGCGTGVMTDLLASAFPEAQVYGIDIAPVPESRHGKRSNVEWIQGDVRGLIGKDPRLDLGSVDYIFERLLMFGMSNWEDYIKSISTLLRPGGWLEIQESSCQLRSPKGERKWDSHRWYNEFMSEGKALGLDIEIGDRVEELLASTSGIGNVKGNKYTFSPISRADRPDLASLENQIPDLFNVVFRKVLSSRGRTEEDTQELLGEMNIAMEKGFAKEDRYTFGTAVGQKQ